MISEVISWALLMGRNQDFQAYLTSFLIRNDPSTGGHLYRASNQTCLNFFWKQMLSIGNNGPDLL